MVRELVRAATSFEYRYEIKAYVRREIKVTDNVICVSVYVPSMIEP